MSDIFTPGQAGPAQGEVPMLQELIDAGVPEELHPGWVNPESDPWW